MGGSITTYQSDMKQILFLVYEFPPLNSGGSHRPYRFVKYLAKLNFQVTVVTPNVKDEDIDDSMLHSIENEVKIVRTKIEKSIKFESMYAKQYLNIFDSEAKKWKKHLYPVLEELLKDNSFDVMYVTAPPFSIADLGVEISKKYNIPLILDMRDHWSYWNITPFTSYLHYKAIVQKENQWFRQANAIVVVSEQMVEDFRDIHKNIEASKFHTVKNSFVNEIVYIDESTCMQKLTTKKLLKIGYVGSFYYAPYQRSLIFNPWWKKKPHQWFQYTPRKEDWLYRSPYFFFKTLQKLCIKYPQYKELIKVEFIGAKTDWLKGMIKEFGLESSVSLKGFLSHKESLKFQKSCDFLLATSMKVIGGRDYCIAGKSYEYLAQQKPILAFMTEGTQKDFLTESGMAVIFDADRVEENVEILKNTIDGKIILKPNREFIQKVSSKETTKQLADIIKKAAL